MDIMVSKSIPNRFQINREALKEYLQSCGTMLDDLIFVWSDEENEDFQDEARATLYRKTGDEYAFYVASECIGQLWLDRNACVVNAGAIAAAALESEALAKADHMNDDRYSVTNLYPQNVLETVFWLFFCTTASDDRVEEMAKEKYIESYDADMLSRIFPNL